MWRMRHEGQLYDKVKVSNVIADFIVQYDLEIRHEIPWSRCLVVNIREHLSQRETAALCHPSGCVLRSAQGYLNTSYTTANEGNTWVTPPYTAGTCRDINSLPASWCELTSIAVI